VTIMEGESLINDGVALTAFGLAVEALAHPFTFAHGATRLAEVVVAPQRQRRARPRAAGQAG
jgi:NhaP-type Na+/H+ or K+/H+ antiporter